MLFWIFCVFEFVYNIEIFFVLVGFFNEKFLVNYGLYVLFLWLWVVVDELFWGLMFIDGFLWLFILII